MRIKTETLLFVLALLIIASWLGYLPQCEDATDRAIGLPEGALKLPNQTK